MKTLFVKLSTAALLSTLSLGLMAEAKTSKVVSPGSKILQMLNEKTNRVRLSILKARAENCAELSPECREMQEAEQKNDYVFSDKDLLLVVASGDSASMEPCKSEECYGQNVVTREFLGLVKIRQSSRWDHKRSVIPVELSYVKITQQKNGATSTSIELNLFQSPAN